MTLLEAVGTRSRQLLHPGTRSRVTGDDTDVVMPAASPHSKPLNADQLAGESLMKLIKATSSVIQDHAVAAKRKHRSYSWRHTARFGARLAHLLDASSKTDASWQKELSQPGCQVEIHRCASSSLGYIVVDLTPLPPTAA